VSKPFTFEYGGQAITELHGVNNVGSAVGEAGNSQRQLGFELQAGTFSSLRPPGRGTYYYVIGTGLNNLNDAVGFVSKYDSNQEGFVYRNGRYTLIDYPGASSTGVYGINDDEILVGYYSYVKSAFYGFAAQKGKFLSLTYPAATYTICHGINKAGTIVGEAIVGSTTLGFITSPIKAEQFDSK